MTPRDALAAPAPARELGAADREALAEFARWAIRESAFQAADLSGLEVQEKAYELGLLERTTYDPAKHGPSDEAEEGMEFFVFGAALAKGRHG